jgi:putative sigma-54 modulation protein
VQVKLSVRHGHLSDETQKIIREKAGKLLHFFERLTLIEVTVDMQQKESKHVEFVVQAEHKHDFVARESNGEVLVALDHALAKIEGQLRRYKEKIQDHRRDPSAGEIAAAGESRGPTEE